MMISEPEPEQRTERSVHNFIDSHLRELKWAAYGLAGIGFIIVLRRIKATTKFIYGADIPPHFIEKNYRLQGHVRKVSANGELLVEHVPILQLRRWSPNTTYEETDLLRVTVAGVSLTPDAVKWLRDTTFNKHIWFQFMQREGPVLDCDVTLKQTWMRGHFSISEELVKRGLCAVRHFQTPPSSKAYDKLLTRLLALEHTAQGKGKGLWKEKEYKGQGWLGNAKHWIKHRIQSLFRRRNK